MSDSPKTTEPVVHPVQTNYKGHTGRLPQIVTLKAYEVYRHIHGEQKAMVTGGCRGGFGVGEVVAFLYAATFPKAEWRERADEAFTGMKL